MAYNFWVEREMAVESSFRSFSARTQIQFLIVMIIVLFNLQNVYASDSRDPVPVNIKELPHGLNVRQVDCSYFSKARLKANNISITKNGIHDYDNQNSGVFGYKLINMRNNSKDKMSNDAFVTGLVLHSARNDCCYTIPMLCDESDIHNAFSKTDINSMDKNSEFIHIGFRITDDCDEVHGSLNGPSYFVLTINKRTLELDGNRCYYEVPAYDGKVPFDDSMQLRYSRGYKHVPMK